MGFTRAVVREADAVGRHIAEGTRRRTAGAAQAVVEKLGQQLRHTVDLVQRVLAQTRARILKGDTHYPDKVLSLFEPHTEAIRKGKAAKPTEVGKLVRLQETEAQFITDYVVCATRVPDQELWGPALEKHRQLFGRAGFVGRCAGGPGVKDGSVSSSAGMDSSGVGIGGPTEWSDGSASG